MIVSASRRTDIPAFYGEWFIRRVRAGFCEVANPFRPSAVRRVSLAPQDVDCIVFWTRYPVSLLPHLEELEERGYRYYFLYTLLDYPAVLEPCQPPLAARMDALARTVEATAPGRVVWRYDPIVLSSATPASFHEETFARLAEALRGSVSRVIVSFLDVYAKVARSLAGLSREGVRIAAEAEVRETIPELAPRLARIAAEAGMEIRSCAELRDLESCGIWPGRCIDDALIASLFGIAVSGEKDPGQRAACRCVRSCDIGAYDTCLFGCRYCYATASLERARENARRHDPGAPALLAPRAT